MRPTGAIGRGSIVAWLLFAFVGCGGDDGGSSCGNGRCEAGETAQSCAVDCSTPASCGDRMCNGAETCATCAQDCGACPARCGDGICNGTESCSTCSADCGVCPPRCGDGVCNGGETCSSCSSDCGACLCNPQVPTSCSGENVCVNSSCVNAFGRVYTVVVVSATLSERDRDGASWDFPGGFPDPYAAVSLNGAWQFSTTVRDNTLTPTWYDIGRMVIPGGSSLRVDVYDEDGATADDWMFACAFDLSAAALRQRELSCSGSLGSLILDVMTQ